ncbi:hypothetical protein G3O08_10220 [Cryomorpha ignava]|uniref:Uncharacterized protein n=1 Tax=Cryomorpha ignava TaxID=101383 RepID=A0A7K3WT85_9FLAO|nr:hypothetical protein [Cryomorpha ignava]NEN23875.1 hypothetical protein [Cryomorpha ignava]
MMKKIQLILSLAGLLIFSSAYSQCRTFVKTSCAEAMGEYIPSENFNGAKLSPGDMAEVKMTFYAGEKYRLLICSHPMIGNVDFQVLDKDGVTLYNNTEDNQSDHFDFSLLGTQELTIVLKVSPDNKSALNPQGCVAILIGRLIQN